MNTEKFFQPVNGTRLAIFRILFGFCMTLDVFQERGLEDADLRFGDKNHCFFPLFFWIHPPSLQIACVLYLIMLLGSLGIMFGYKFRYSCAIYFIPYVYFFLLDKSRWNNHSYLFGLITILLFSSKASNCFSLDAVFSLKNELENPPAWNYLILKFQFSLLYFYAAVKKFDADWLAGYSMRNISKHRILAPIGDLLGENILEYYFIHLGGFGFDLLAAFLLNIKQLKKFGFLASVLFHGLNSQLFEIGMFPYVCIVSLILFMDDEELNSTTNSLKNWTNRGPNSKNIKTIKPNQTRRQKRHSSINTSHPASPSSSSQSKLSSSQPKHRKFTLALLIFYIAIQLIFPFTHSITKGYNNWTQGLYGYSWDMMVHSWDTLHTKITVKDLKSNLERYLDPDIWTSNDRWSSHADMAKQYAECIQRNLAGHNLTDIQIYFDVWKSLNGRFQQRIFDPNIDILQAPWSPFSKVEWVLPLLTQFSYLRQSTFKTVSKEIYNWTSSSNVIFVADFPGLYLENYLPSALANVSLILMQGEIILEQPDSFNITLHAESNNENFDFLSSSNRLPIKTDTFHKIHTIGSSPSNYLYIYTNQTADKEAKASNSNTESKTSSVPICQILYDTATKFVKEKAESFSRSAHLIIASIINLLFDIPMVYRTQP